jgi:heterogeneous nuclear ribonucleoprotein F/H
MDQTARGSHNRDRTPEAPRTVGGYADDTAIKYIKCKNLPPNCDKEKIIEFFKNIPIAYANIALVFDQAVRFCQEAILAVNNMNDQLDALAQSGRYIFNYQILVEPTDAQEWNTAQQSQKVFFSRDEKILVRMRGLPFSVKKDEVLQFFHGYDVVPDSVIIGEMSNGKKTGEGVILFKSEDEAARAVSDRNGSNIGRRWIELYLHPYSHFHNFYQSQHHEEFVYLDKYITEENKFRTVRIRGLPFSATKKDMVNFFRDFNLTNNEIVFEIKDGRPTGRALAFFIDHTTAQRAISALDKEYIGNRYVELEQVANLPHEFS